MTPLIVLINLLSRGVLALLHIDPSAQSRTMTESELRTIVDVSHEDGVIESEEKEMIYNVFDLGDAKQRTSWCQEYMWPLRISTAPTTNWLISSGKINSPVFRSTKTQRIMWLVLLIWKIFCYMTTRRNFISVIFCATLTLPTSTKTSPSFS